jgi:hypothetical protein
MRARLLIDRMHAIVLGALLVAGSGVLAARAQAAETMSWINVDPQAAPALAAAAHALGLTPARTSDAHQLTRVMLYQAEQPGVAMDRALVDRLADHLRQGNALLITISPHPGTTAYALTPLSPTTAWLTLLASASRGGGGEVIESGAADAAFFPAAAPHLRLEHAWRLKPVHAVERGETRYESLEHTIAYLERPVKAGESFLSRPLLNRDWQPRLRSADVRDDALLITGRYGAGRVAVFAADAAAGDAALWEATLRWLAEVHPLAAGQLQEPLAINAHVAVDREHRALTVAATNPGDAPLQLPVIARLSTWEGALMGDVAGTLALPAHGSGSTTLALPARSLLSVQALAVRDALMVRVGVLGPEGAALWWETRLSADLTPPLTIDLALDELRALPRTFHAPGPETLHLDNRGGDALSTYAVAPGQELHATVTVGNGARNLAPLAEVSDGRGDPSLAALTDGASSPGKPADGIAYSGQWQGGEREEQLTFRFAAAHTMSGLVLIGTAPLGDKETSNPGAVEISIDGHVVLAVNDLDQRFAAGYGRAAIALPPGTGGSELRLRLPWSPATATQAKRKALRLGEVEIWGCAGAAPPAITATVHLRLIVPGAAARELGNLTLVVPGGARSTATLGFTPPAPGNGGLGAYRIEASCPGIDDAGVPLLVIAPAHPLQPISDLQDAGHTAEFGCIVTRGVRTYLELGTGSRESGPGWGQPEDLVYCYAHGLKQLGVHARTLPGRLYLSENDFRHYANPWTCFPDGQSFFSIAAPALVERNREQKSWKEATAVRIFHSDRWDTGPSVNSMFGWQELVEFDRYLGVSKLPRLAGRTRQALSAEVSEQRLGEWRAWQLERYVGAVGALKAAVTGAGKRLVISAQGVPLVPLRVLDTLAGTIQGMSDDNTWGAMDEDLPGTAGRQLALKALNPSWRMASNLVWGYDNSIFNNPHWHAAVGITESSRRHLATRSWRGSIALDGSYHSMMTLGYGMNAGVSYLSTANDWQQGWDAAERQSLIAPDGPIGAGVVVSTGPLDDPAHPDFSGGGMGGSAVDHLADGIARLISRLHYAQVSIPFAANATAAAHWNGLSPLVCLDVCGWMPSERAQLSTWAAKGVPLILFAGDAPLPGDLATLVAGLATTEVQIGGHAVLAGGNRILVGCGFAHLDGPAAVRLAGLMRAQGDLAIGYPPGTAGYGFSCGRLRCVTIEDWAEQARTVELHLRATASATAAVATGLNEHRAYAVRREGADWVVSVPLRAGDGELIVVEEQP